MASIRLRVNEVKSINAKIRHKSSSLSNIKRGILSIKYNLNDDVLYTKNIESRINNAINSINLIESRLKHLEIFINISMECYSKAEDYIIKASFKINQYTGSRGTCNPCTYRTEIDKFVTFGNSILRTGSTDHTNIFKEPITNSLESSFGNKLFEGSVFNDSIHSEGQMLGFDSMGELRGDFLSYKGEAKNYNSFDLKKGDVSIGIQAEVLGCLSKGTAKGNLGCLSGDASVTMGLIAVMGEATCALFQNGEFDPEVELKAKAEAVGLKGELNAKFGDKDSNIHAGAIGKVGVAEAEAEVKFTEEGVKAKAEVGAAVFQGEVEAGFDIFGIKIDFTAEGEALSVGAGAEFDLEEDSVELGGKLSFIAGLGLKMKVSW
ncbi:MAG: hypothetical protein AB6733_22070 [Clostridiaceae bacterium]